MLGQVYSGPAEAGSRRKPSSRSARAPIRKTQSSRLVVAMILEMQKKIPEAKQKYDEVLAIDQRSVIAANNLAYLYAEANENLDRALILAQTAVEQAPDNPDVRDTLGWVYYQKAVARSRGPCVRGQHCEESQQPDLSLSPRPGVREAGQPRSRAAVLPGGLEAQAGLPGGSAGVEDDRWLKACSPPAA